MELLNDIIIIVGNCGSGKTEVAVNLALNQKSKGNNVSLVDLDLINPYFRVRELRNFLIKQSINIIVPPKEYMYADIPILSPEVSGVIKGSSDLIVLDVGGDGIGTTVLGTLSNFLVGKNIKMLYVVNPNRPRTNSIESCLMIRDEIEAAAKIKINGIIDNANLMNETVITDLYFGHDFTLDLSIRANIELFCVTVPGKFLPYVDYSRFSCSILPLWRQLVPPWLDSEKY